MIIVVTITVITIYLSLLLVPAGVDHPLDAVGVGGEAEGAVEAHHAGLGVEGDVGNATASEVGHETLHHRPAKPHPLQRRLHHHIPHHRVEHPVPCRPRERHRLPWPTAPLGLLHPHHRAAGVAESAAEPVRVPPGEPHPGEHVVEGGHVEAVRAPPDAEAAGLEFAVGHGEGGGGDGEEEAAGSGRGFGRVKRSEGELATEVAREGEGRRGAAEGEEDAVGLHLCKRLAWNGCACRSL